MALQHLRAQAYALANVETTPQLKAKYPEIRAWNLRQTSSWQRVVAFLRANPVAQSGPKQSITDLRTEVYALAQVATVQQLKRKYESLQALNFRFKTAWETARDVLKTAPNGFQTWLANPPKEYQALFEEIDALTERLDSKLETAKRLGKDAHEMAKSLEQTAGAAHAEAKELRQTTELAEQAAAQASLN